MNIDKINSWLALTANIGVLIGIVVVAIELQQTRIAMNAEASTIRTQMSIENSRLSIENNINQLMSKVAGGETLTDDEDKRIRQFWRRQVRYFENLHYQWQLGVLDEEIWETNLMGIGTLLNNPGFNYTYPDWPESFIGRTHRSSFIELVESFRR